ncbi:hypothetical protein ABIA54_002323 [Pseudomonas sp. EB276 TE3739]|nr:hypothetical protein [Pseudomonas koreensis]
MTFTTTAAITIIMVIITIMAIRKCPDHFLGDV